MKISDKQNLTKYLKLPFQFDENRLMSNLKLITESQWIPHFNKDVYSGTWNSIALFAPEGNANNIFALNDREAAIYETRVMERCFYFREVIRQFECKLLSVRLLRLGVGAKIKPHCDYNLGYEDNNFRLHIPIITNPNVEFMLDGTRLKMLSGECWYTNVNYTHSVANNGKTDRVHLVIDGERNDWSDKLFFSLAPKESFFPENQEIYSSEMIKKMIEELKYSDEPAARKLLAELQTEIKSRSHK